MKRGQLKFYRDIYLNLKDICEGYQDRLARPVKDSDVFTIDVVPTDG